MNRSLPELPDKRSLPEPPEIKCLPPKEDGAPTDTAAGRPGVLVVEALAPARARAVIEVVTMVAAK